LSFGSPVVLVFLIPLILSIGIAPVLSSAYVTDSPKQQMATGIALNQISCNAGKVLMVSATGKPGCAFENHVDKLVKYGWGTIVKKETTMPTTTQEETRPNILIVVADDMGYSDLSMFGGEINTPVIDELASQGMTFYNHHTSATCSPTRSMFLTGTDNHLAGLGTMGELLHENQIGKPGYEGHLNDKVVTVATLLNDAGYHTYMAGKWHLGEEDGYKPHDRGFEETFTLIRGAGNHYNELGFIPDEMTRYFRNGESTSLPDDFYSTDSYTDLMIDFIDKNHGDGKPLFMYLPLTAPHWPLQAPQEFIQKYDGKYDMGWDNLREQRFEKQKELGLISAELELPPRDPTVSAWDDLTPEEQEREAKKMAVYSAMVESMDWNMGKLIQHLKDIDEYDNTIVFFFSDHGGDYVNLEKASKDKSLDKDEYLKWIEDTFDNSVENIGNSDSFVSYGKPWAQVSNTPLFEYKSTVAEGGIRVPLIIKHPTLTDGEKTNIFVSSKEITPTILDAANVEHPGTFYDGHEIHPMIGKSLLPFLEGEVSQVYADDEPIGWELFDHKALYYGDYKILNIASPIGDGMWKLYNISEDPRELVDISAEEPKLLEQMIQMYDQYAEEVGVIPPEGEIVS